MTETERQYFAANLPKIHLPPAIIVATRGGGNPTLMSEGDFIHLKADVGSDNIFIMRWFRPQFLNLMAGGQQRLPGVGILITSPIGRDRVRLSLVPERKGNKDFQVGAFEADLRLSEFMAKL